MSAPYKIIYTYQYTEVGYYDGDGNEVARERGNDDSLWDESGPEPLDDWELEDFGGAA